MNQVEGIYSAELGVTFRVVFQNAWATEADPYEATAAGDVLREFSDYWNENFGGVDRDLAHMWTGKDMDGAEIGMAWMGVVCRSLRHGYGISQRWSGSQRIVLTAHEIGHNSAPRTRTRTPVSPRPARARSWRAMSATTSRSARPRAIR